MTNSEALIRATAFVDVNGFSIKPGIGIRSGLYSIVRDYGDRVFPLCPYMEPKELILWIDGYEIGRRAARKN